MATPSNPTHLSCQAFQEILRRTPGPKRVHENRRAPRTSLSAAGIIRPLREGVIGSPLAVDIQNISVQSIGLRAAEGLGRGDHFFLDLPRPNAKRVWLEYLVTRSRVENDGRYFVGARFIRAKDPSQAAAAVRSCARGSADCEQAAHQMIEHIRRAILSW